MIASVLTALLAGSPMKELDSSALQAALEQAKANKYVIMGQVGVTDDQWKEALEALGINPGDLLNCPIRPLPPTSLPETETPETTPPETEAPSLPETPENPSLPETEKPGNPSLPETESPTPPSQPETETPDTPSQPETETPAPPSQPETETPGAPETEAPGTDQENGGTSLSMAQQVANLVNKERAKAGLPALELRSDISAAAQVRAKETVTSFSHTRPNGTNFNTALTEQQISYRGAGENIAWGQRGAEAVMNAWMNSPGHRANILNSSFRYLGVGYHTTANGTPYWAQLFTY